MKLSYIKSWLAAATLAVSFSACSGNFLDVEPRGKLIAAKVDDYDQLLNNLYLVYINSNAQVPMGDELVAVEPYFTQSGYRTQRLFQWESNIYQSEDNSPELQYPMHNIYQFNKIIEEVMDATEGTDAQKRAIRAEALAGRAWTNFLLINYYGKPYNEQTAATDPGFPIITKADVTQTDFKRASVKVVYDSIVSDLTRAIPDLPVSVVSRFRMSKAAAEGVLGKVYVFMGKFTEALPLLNAALTDMNSTGMSIGLYDLKTEMATGGVYAGTSAPNVAVNKENLLGKQATSSFSRTDNSLVLSPQAAALYKDSDLRRNFYTTTATSGAAYPIAGVLRKNRFSALQFGVLVPELYLLRAECNCRTNNLAGAKQDVETLRASRMPAADVAVPDNLAAQQLPLLQFILEERIREFAVMGYRWFDMRRLSVDPLFPGLSFTHTVYSSTGTPTVYTLKPERLVLRFAPKTLSLSPGLEDNP
ncbi:RagB/SusD family nutrient uptake outer membrane protein [Filimonas effusa]|uniref:RagB/SusD family nutrient uptake outer membrane protein n=1 Tax=Filimonas effusa TaxID=2508721 RepID=A0A4Q1D8C1_9BACT|nr:RagB/SusD family nutrient uptake outer membrane protein [Filimonas effusa]RXK85521.1 RagB/SusD family nutrient uptake outer membrane protein [Filimonas effusa]